MTKASMLRRLKLEDTTFDTIKTAVAQAESKELAEKGFLTSSCCPAFVQYIKSAFPVALLKSIIVLLFVLFPRSIF